MTSITLLQAPDYSEGERRALIDFVLALRKSHVQDFLKRIDLPKSGTKSDLRERIHETLETGGLTHGQLVAFLDSMAPWGKQHIFLYKGPRGDLRSWKQPDHVLQELKRRHLGKLFNAKLPLILPDNPTLSSITHADGKLRVTAVQKREYTERAPGHDDVKEGENGEKIILKAYVPHVSRTLVAFEWDLNANIAMLQITQLQGDTLYEDVAKEFFALLVGWLDIGQFGQVDVRGAIKKLYELEESGKPEARSHAIDIRTLRGSRLSATSPSSRDSVLAEGIIGDAMTSITKEGVGHLGNFYWLAGGNGGPAPNPLKGDVHVFIVGDKSRINFPTPNPEDVVRHVLHRVRALS